MLSNIILFSVFVVAVSETSLRSDLRERFSTWMSQFNINFENIEARENGFLKWIDNDIHIKTINAQNLTYTLGHNHFSAMDSTDFSKYLVESYEKVVPEERGNFLPTLACLTNCVEHYDTEAKLQTITCVKTCLQSDNTLSVEALPESIDWVSKGAVTPVKNQGQCGSCWSFSTTGALEGAYFIQNGKLESFSEQQLVDCDNRQHGGKDMGCNGGLMDNAFSWIEKNGGLCSEDSYPYESGTTKKPGSCETSCSIVEGSDIISFTDVPAKSDDSMMQAITQQPVSVAIQADQKDFQLYTSGVFTGSCGTQLDHGVLVVGYGNKDGENFYKIKNSWGTTWGDEGYIYIGRGSQYNKGQGQCGVLLQPSYPTV